MRKKVITGLLIFLAMSFLLMSCGPSDEKIIEAQAKYRELVSSHNQVAEAYEAIDDDSLMEDLNVLSEKIEAVESFNLYEMKDEEIDILIDTMDSLNQSYSGYLKTIGEIRLTEEAAVLTPYTFTLVNETDRTFAELSLMEKGEKDLVSNALESLQGLLPGQEITGLTVYRDVDNTPWILSLSEATSQEGEEPMAYKFILDESNLSKDGTVLTLKIDESGETIILE